jgi:hypothetical protein
MVLDKLGDRKSQHSGFFFSNMNVNSKNTGNYDRNTNNALFTSLSSFQNNLRSSFNNSGIQQQVKNFFFDIYFLFYFRGQLFYKVQLNLWMILLVNPVDRHLFKDVVYSLVVSLH